MSTTKEKQNLSGGTRILHAIAAVAGFVAAVSLAGCSPNPTGSGVVASAQAPATNEAPALVPALPNRFAKIEYPDAHKPQWGSSEQIYQQTCAYCHDTNIAVQIRGKGTNAQYIKALVRTGRNSMPVFRQTDISDTQLAALADWIQASEAPAGMTSP